MNGIIVEGNTLTIGHTKIIVKYPIKKIEKIRLFIRMCGIENRLKAA